MKPLWIAACALALSSAASHALIITFSDFNSPNTGLPEPHVPAIYDGLEIDQFAVLINAGPGLPVFPSGTRAITVDKAGLLAIWLRSTGVPFIINRIEVAPYAPGGDTSKAATGFDIEGNLNNQFAGYFETQLDPDGQFHWYTTTAHMSGPVDAFNMDDYRGGDWIVDAIDITPVPEPETWALMGVGAVSLMGATWRKRRLTPG